MMHADQRFPAKPVARQTRRNEHDIHAGDRLRVARRLAGLTQQQLADHLGVSFQAVQKYENGENRLAAGRLIKATQILGVNLAFFAGDESARGVEEHQPDRFSTHELDLIRAYRALSDEALRTQLRRLVLAMAREAGAGDH
jgi:transcriptional regulator with XRE-family HTH domain